MESGEEASSVPLMLCSGFLTGDIMVPNSTFQYQLRGTDTFGNMFEHLSNCLVTPTSLDERIIMPLNCPVPQPIPTPSSTTTPSSNPTSCPQGEAVAGLTPVATMCSSAHQTKTDSVLTNALNVLYCISSYTYITCNDIMKTVEWLLW